MLVLSLGFFFHFNLLHCNEFEKADFLGPLRIEQEHKARINDFMSHSITDSLWNSAPEIDQMHRITLQHSFLTTPIGHGSPLPTEDYPLLLDIDNKNWKHKAVRHQRWRPIVPQRVTRPQMSKNRASDSKAIDESSYYRGRWSKPTLHRTKRTHRFKAGTKHRLKPDLLLRGSIAAIQGVDRIIDSVSDVKETIPRKEEGGRYTRVYISETKEKWWKSDRTEEETDQSESSIATAIRSFRQQRSVSAPILRSYFKMIETLQEGYMIVFLLEMTQLIATKEKKAVRNVVRHTDQIIHGFLRSGRLRWFGQPLITVTRKVARLLKDLEIDVIQNHAAQMHYKLRHRNEELSFEVNTILEYADTLYDDVEGRRLFDSLKELAAYPNSSLSGFWVCNSLINNFLRPYRRLKDTEPRRELIDAVNLALKNQLSSTEIRSTLRTGKVGDRPETKPSIWKNQVTQKESHSRTIRPSRGRKIRRHHRSRKRKREKKIFKEIPEKVQKTVRMK